MTTADDTFNDTNDVNETFTWPDMTSLSEVEDEMDIFKKRVEHLRSLSSTATKTEAKAAMLRVKRASMDVRDALKKVSRLQV